MLETLAASCAAFTGDLIDEVRPLEKQLSVDLLERFLAIVDPASAALPLGTPLPLVVDAVHLAATAAGFAITDADADWLPTQTGNAFPAGSLAAEFNLGCLIRSVGGAGFALFIGSLTRGRGLRPTQYVSQSVNAVSSFHAALHEAGSGASPADLSVDAIPDAVRAAGNAGHKSMRQLAFGRGATRAELEARRAWANKDWRLAVLTARAHVLASRAGLAHLAAFVEGMSSDERADGVAAALGPRRSCPSRCWIKSSSGTPKSYSTVPTSAR